MSKSRKPYRSNNAGEPAPAGSPQYRLRLFISGLSLNSLRAVKNLKQICETHLSGDYELVIIDIYQQPELVIDEQIIVTPVMIIKKPLPERRVVGDLSDTDLVLEILNVRKTE